MVLQKLFLGWPSWLEASYRPRRPGDTAPSRSGLVANDCFGRVAEPERKALEGLIEGEPCPVQPAAAEPPNHDPTEPAA